MSGQTAYEINGVTVAMTEFEKRRWDSANLRSADFRMIRVHVGEERWPGGWPSLKTVRNSSLFGDVAEKLGVSLPRYCRHCGSVFTPDLTDSSYCAECRRHFAEQQSSERPWHEWRDVKKELPTEFGLFLVCFQKNKSVPDGMIMACFNDTTGEWVVPGYSEITHWMPMPPNPVAKEDADV